MNAIGERPDLKAAVDFVSYDTILDALYLVQEHVDKAKFTIATDADSMAIDVNRQRLGLHLNLAASALRQAMTIFIEGK